MTLALEDPGSVPDLTAVLTAVLSELPDIKSVTTVSDQGDE
ncbi:hypothetical protein [Actinomadura opuntiae]|nr:hypothetical protein [Actinomadura sp. OS1-43]MDL4813687.1 hypothetical protein [Actinomadura sp. OS1-43]